MWNPFRSWRKSEPCKEPESVWEGSELQTTCEEIAAHYATLTAAEPEPDDNVFPLFPGCWSRDTHVAKDDEFIDPDAVLRGAEGLAQVVVLGFTQDGAIYIAGSGNFGELLWIVEVAKATLVQSAMDDE